jgi:mannose-6-phosphate isomerase-like protein (cupin superfamily)
MNPEKNYTASMDRRRAGIADALLLVAAKKEGLPSAAVFEHGTLQVKMYKPDQADRQTPHTRDELYVIASGSGWFVNGKDRHPFQTGDVLFVPAGVAHRFEEFTDDFCTWVMFYGPEGGEHSGANR